MRTSSDINLRLIELVKHFTDGNATAFARTIQIAQQRFDRLLKPVKKSGKFPIVKPEIVNMILAQYESVSEVWLLSGAGSMIKTLVTSPASFAAPPPIGVPFYNVDFIHEYDLIMNKHAESISYYVNIRGIHQADFWCYATGRSMEPEMASGDLVAMKEVLDINKGIIYGSVYGIVTKNFCTVRRVTRGSNDRYLTLIPSNTNPEYAEQEIPRSSIEHLFQVLCCVKKL